ncbi:hypothetical protein EC973_005809 [Apophysomyces ossiformis]|uniref:Uncharacterized protein n=1 Tax=Apophysomyces ossiformis TaxID=679940 RepID=A0A8H7BP18_9FUNG|nr:hypothetical protein EC973_005809 [Apophysomyces ossiformis]
MSSVDNVAVDLARLSFDTPDSAYLLSKPLLNEPAITVTKDKAARTRNRNRQCVPSDDEDEEEEEEEDEESSDDEKASVPRDHLQQRRASGISTPSKPARRTQPLPSDDEDSEDDDDEEPETDKKSMYQIQGAGSSSQIHRSTQRPGHQQHQDMSTASFVAPISATEDEPRYNNIQADDDDNEVLGQHMRGPALLGLPEGSHLQQLQQMQQYHQAQLAQFQYQQQQPHPSKSSSSQLLRPHSPHQRVSMSGMDLLKQLEQEKADAKRQKPKLNTSNVKIEGLLAKLPEPGSHNISFQQLQQQQGMKRRSQRPVSSHGYLDMSNNYQRMQPSAGPAGDRRSHVPNGYGYSNDYASANPGYRASTPGTQPVYPYPYQQQQQQQQQYMNLGNPSASGSMTVPRGDIPSRPGSALSQHDVPVRRSADSHTP